MDLTVRHEKTDSGGQFLLERGGESLGELVWRRTAPGQVTAEHTRVDDSLRGHGAGGLLFDALVEWARAEGQKVSATCSYVKGQLEKRPETRDIVA